ncbi:MAG: ParB/RepB/Spo0J family partition protein [Patescibacteria group bacterium]
MLGRGLESLIPNKGEQSEDRNKSEPMRSFDSARPSATRPRSTQDDSGSSVYQIEVEKIKRNPLQPRKNFNENALAELAASIGEHGIIQPLIVSKVQKDTDFGTQVEYQLIAGERRLMAAKKIGLERVPAIVRAVAQEKDRLEVAIVENVQRQDLNPIEAARSYARLQEEFGLTQREIAARIGKSRETIGNVLRLLNLPTIIQDAIANDQLSDSQGRLLLSIDDPNQQKHLFEEIINNNISVRELKARISGIRKFNEPRQTDQNSNNLPTAADPELEFIKEKLQEALGTKVSLQKNDRGGKITINFFSPEEFKAIVNKLLPIDKDNFA